MNSIIQRPASVRAQVQPVGDILEFRWRPRVANYQGATRKHRSKRRSDQRNLVEALVLIGVLAMMAGFAYVQALHGGTGL